MKRKTKLLLVAALLSASLSTTFAGCGLFSGNYALTDFVVNTENVALEYKVGDEVDFSALVMTAMYNDDSSQTVEISSVKFYLGEEDITNNLRKITEEKGTKTITVEFVSEYGSDTTSFTVKVVASTTPSNPNPENPNPSNPNPENPNPENPNPENPNPENPNPENPNPENPNPENPEPENPEPAKIAVDSFAMPAFYNSYLNSLTAATNDPTANGFEGKFFKNESAEYYIVGNENAFKFLPVTIVFDEENFQNETLDNFVAQTSIKVLQEEQFVALVKGNKEGETYVYEYKLGETLVATEYAAKNEFVFTSSAVDMVLEISVKPSDVVYEYDSSVQAKTITVQVKNAFNVYDASQVAVMDNTDNVEWAELKGASGLTAASKNSKGVVFHSDIKITKENIPADYQYTLPSTYQIEYKKFNADGTTTTGSPEFFGLDRTFLWDKYNEENYDLFQRVLAEGESYAFYGNYFALDVTAMPLVASFDAGVSPTRVSGKTWFGNDFSNTTLIKFVGLDTTMDASDESVTFNNLVMKGNAKQEQIVVTSNTTGYQADKGETLIYCGALIFAKSWESTTNFDNIRMQNFFISLFADWGSTANYSRAKCYDSYQNAMFVYSDAKVNLQSSYFERTGGPIIIAQHCDPDQEGSELNYANIVISEDCVMKSALTGEEIWFKSVGATAVIQQIKAINNLFIRDTEKSIFDYSASAMGEMNIVVALMNNSSSAADALGNEATQGSVVYGDPENPLAPRLDRRVGSPLGEGIRTLLKMGVPVFNIGAQVFFGYTNTPEDPTSIMIMNSQNQPGAAEMKLAAADADYLGFSQGGISILFGFVDAPTM